jgi:two-component system, cell cycle response regulator
VHIECGEAQWAEISDVSVDSLLTRPANGPRSCRVLVVDDDALVRARLSALLSAQYEVEVAATAEEALRILDVMHCQIVLTDWKMPGMDGLGLCRHVRRRDQEAYVYVVMLTVRDSEHDILAGLAAGADAYVVKGATIAAILAQLDVGRRITLLKQSLRAVTRDGRSLSHTDPVTGAHNFGYLTQHLPRELARSQRYGHALTILKCHIDEIERVRRQFGAAAGDELIRDFVSRSEDCTRRMDWVARTEGDAFLIVLPETSAAGGHRVAQKLQRIFGLHPLSTSAEPIGFNVTIEVAVVQTKGGDDGTQQVESLLREASGRRMHAERLVDDSQSAIDTSTDLGAYKAPIGGSNGLN